MIKLYEIEDSFNELEESVEEFEELYHDDKIIAKVHRSTRIGEVNGLPQYNADIELEDDKHVSLFEGKHRLVAQEGRLTLEIL